MSNGKFRGQLTIGYNENGSPKRKSFTGKTKKEVSDKMKASILIIIEVYYLQMIRSH
ncbi:hypothetical protein QTH19_13040 [Clostridium perfringens]|nr:hypothetical protein [Clostridium perfringens]